MNEADALLDANERTNRLLRCIALAFGVILLIVSAFGAGYTLVNVRATKEIAAQGREQSEYNTSLMRIIVAVTGCQPTDPPEACEDRLIDASFREGQARLLVVDCLIRRALAGLPSPPEGQPCEFPNAAQ